MSDHTEHAAGQAPLSWRRLKALVTKETRQLVRDKSNLMVGLFLPVVLILIFGYGLSFDVKNAPVAIVTEDTSPAAQDVVEPHRREARRPRIHLRIDHVRGHHARKRRAQPAVGRRIVGQDGVSDAEHDQLVHEYDASFDTHLPTLVVWPTSTRQVVEVVKVARQAGVPIVPRGAGTGLAGGSVPTRGGLIVSMLSIRDLMRVDMERMDEEIKFLHAYLYQVPPKGSSERSS